MIPLRPRLLYLRLRGPFPLPLFLALPLLAWEWALLLFLFLLKTRALLRGGPPWRVPLGAVFALRGLPPLVLVRVEREGVGVTVGLW
ncbi:hypothetical protein FJNA_19160 [Thermus sp. FJN-A]